MLYQYVFSPRVNLNLFILISYLIPCDVIHKGGYFNSPYNQGIPSLHQDILVIKTSQLVQVQIIQWSRFPFGNLPFTPYPYSQ